MHSFESGLEMVAFGIDMAALVIMLWGVLMSLKPLLTGMLFMGGVDQLRYLQQVRCGLGTSLLIALEFMIVSDIIHSILSRSMDDMLLLGVIVVIRTAIGFFLGRELNELSHREPSNSGAS